MRHPWTRSLKQTARCPDPRPKSDPQALLVYLVASIRAGRRDRAMVSIRLRGKTVAWAAQALEAIEWAMIASTNPNERNPS